MIATEMDITLASQHHRGGRSHQRLAGGPAHYGGKLHRCEADFFRPSVATVNNFGKVTGIAPGKATITASTGDVSCSATVTVVAAPSSSTGAAESLSLNTNYLVLKPGASSKITGSVAPSTASSP